MKKSFTLVEIMMVIVIIALLVAVAIPAIVRARMRYNAIEQLTSGGRVVEELTEIEIAKQIKIIKKEWEDSANKPRKKEEKTIITEFQKDFRSY